jgi:hypothetical protein
VFSKNLLPPQKSEQNGEKRSVVEEEAVGGNRVAGGKG